MAMYMVYCTGYPHNYNSSDYTEMYLSCGAAIPGSFSQVIATLGDLVRRPLQLYPQLQCPVGIRGWWGTFVYSRVQNSSQLLTKIGYRISRNIDSDFNLAVW